MSNGAERRRAQRVTCVLPLQISADGTPRIIETLTKDLSVTGLRCLSPTSTPLTSKVSLEITLGKGARPFSLQGRVVWYETVPNSHQFYLGLAFDHLSEVNTRRLSRYIEKLSASQPA
jgi:c-di-GMP-binding flagellar brake protein YcgR